MKKFTGEFIGTFALVLVGTGAIVADQVSGGAVSQVGIGLCFGLVVMTMIYAVGDVSGAHLNPAVSAAFLFAKRISVQDFLLYTASQTAGGLTASTALKFMVPAAETLGQTHPSISVGAAFLMELILTFLLMFVIIHVATGAKEVGLMAGVAIGGTVGMEALFAGPFTGASMNPVRSLAPALMAGDLEHLWLYLTAPFIGAVLAIFTCRIMRDDCCKDGC